MRYPLPAALAFVCFCQLVSAQSLPQPSDRTAAADFVRAAVVRALNYEQGDRASLIDARDDFTPDGWREFMRWMSGFVDANGAPQSGSSFVPTANAVWKEETAGVMHLQVDGTLKQTQNRSSTTYRVTVKVELRGSPLRIERLRPTVCNSADKLTTCP